MIWGGARAIRGRKGREEEDVSMQHETKMKRRRKKKEKEHFRLLPLK